MNPAESITDDYRAAFVVDKSPSEVFEAINDVRAWWSKDTDGITDQVGEEFTFRGRDIHRSLIRVEELVPGERVVWRVIENHMNFIEDQSEWVGTQIRFDIASVAGGTEVRFTHVGLVPAYECYEVCSGAWGWFMDDSLRKLIETGVGEPMAVFQAS